MSRQRQNMQQILHERPPNYDELAEVFGLRAGQGVIFSWGRRLYVPDGDSVTPAILAHELVHAAQQGDTTESILAWWRRYIDSAKFRLEQELPAHLAEYRHIVQHGNRRERRCALARVAGRLSSPLYGKMLGRSVARDLIRQLGAAT